MSLIGRGVRIQADWAQQKLVQREGDTAALVHQLVRMLC